MHDKPHLVFSDDTRQPCYSPAKQGFVGWTKGSSASQRLMRIGHVASHSLMLRHAGQIGTLS